MKTSYFAKLKKLPDGFVPVSICGKAPDWYEGVQYKKLAPKYDFFMEWKKTQDNNYYIKCFNEQVLSLLNPETVVKELETFTGVSRDKICLICYEKPSDFCHRFLVAEWLSDNGIECSEIDI